MKRILCACLAALLLWAAAAAMAAEYDFSGLTLEQLYDVRGQVDKAIEAQESAGEANFYDDGSYLVGTDLPEGDYVLIEQEDALFASVVVRAGGSADDALILHKLISGQADIHLKKDTWVTLSEVRARPLEASEAADCSAVGEGAYLVGVQLPAGRYTAVAQDRAPLSSYSIYSGILGTDAQLTKFEVLHGEVELTLADGDYIELSGCTITAIE